MFTECKNTRKCFYGSCNRERIGRSNFETRRKLCRYIRISRRKPNISQPAMADLIDGGRNMAYDNLIRGEKIFREKGVNALKEIILKNDR